MRLNTPFGEVVILVDDIAVAYSIVEKEKKENYKEVLGAYRIIVDCIPDGKKHEIKCIIPDMKYSDKEPESGEDIECQAFYSCSGEKISICLCCETGFLPDGRRWSEKYDYDACYLEKGMSYKMLEKTVESRWIFGVAWIDKVLDEYEQLDHNRAVQTWLAADVTLH